MLAIRGRRAALHALQQDALHVVSELRDVTPFTNAQGETCSSSRTDRRRGRVDLLTVSDAALSLADPRLPWWCPRLRVYSRHPMWMRRLQHVLVAGLLLAALQPRAWDAERMMASARKLGPQAVAGATALQAVMQSAADADEDAKLQALNQFFNRRVRSADDAQLWGEVDHWASPLETLHKGAGDCEDFAIAKYFALLALGIPMNKLRLVYVRAEMGGPGGPVQAHMVLAYYAVPQAEPLILDNLITELRPASRRPDLVPVFSFNGEGLWQGVNGVSAGDPSVRLSRWREILAKARAEGFQ